MDTTTASRAFASNLIECRAFVNSLLYSEEKRPLSVDDAVLTLEQWRQEGSIEPPEDFSPELFSLLWNQAIRS